MVSKSIILLVVISAVAQQITSTLAGCTFVPHPWFPDDWYTCEISGAVISNENEIFDFSGNHVGSRSNANVTTVRFVDSQIDVIPSNLFSTFINVETLEANNVGLKRLNVGTLKNCMNLRFLNLGNNSIPRLENGVFKPCGLLREVRLGSNQLNHIDANVFAELPRLQLIDLSNNQITTFATNLFQRIDNLASINLSHNKITEIPSHAFRNLGLTSLHLNNNLISTIGLGAFSNFGTRNTRSGGLQLNNNQIKRLTNDIFANGWCYVISFHIENNGLSAIEPGFFNIFSPSPLGLTVFAEGNDCVDGIFRQRTTSQLRGDFENCLAKF